MVTELEEIFAAETDTGVKETLQDTITQLRASERVIDREQAK